MVGAADRERGSSAISCRHLIADLPLSCPFDKSKGHPPPQGGRVLVHNRRSGSPDLSIWKHRHLQPCPPFDEIGQAEVAFTFLATEIPRREEPAQPAVGGAIGGPDGDIRRPVTE